MRHHNSARKFGRETDQRDAFIRSLASSCILHGSITTTLPRAKEIRPYIEKLVTRAKNPTIANRRIIDSRLKTADRKVAKRLIDTIAPAYKDRAGGYLRITRLGTRSSDGALKAKIEFV